jgi:sec-independent protein translocase protein TatA
MPFGFHPLWLVALLVIVLIVFGPGKLPELGGALGRGIQEFRKASNEIREEVSRSVSQPESTSGATDSSSGAAEQRKTEAETRQS